MSNNFIVKNICKIGFTYVGAVIGAGFASGQEVFQFFVLYGVKSFVGIAIAGIFFVTGGIMLLSLTKSLKINNYYEAFYELSGKKLGLIIDIIYIILILGSISVMLAGSGTIFQNTLGVNYTYGVLVTLFIVIVTVIKGVNGILFINTILIPFLISVIIYTSLKGIVVGIGQNVVIGNGSFTFFPWYLSSLMYASFNIFMSMAIMSSIGAREKNNKVLIGGGILGGLILTIILLMMGGVIFLWNHHLFSKEMPMLFIASLMGSFIYIIYTICVWFAMVTTAVAHVYSFINRVTPLFKISYYNSAMLTIIVVLPLTRFGFASLVGFLYPVFGVITLVVLIIMLIGWVRLRRV